MDPDDDGRSLPAHPAVEAHRRKHPPGCSRHAGRDGRARGQPFLVDALDALGSDRRVSAEIVRVLAMIGLPSVLPPTRLLESPDRHLRDLAVWALARIADELTVESLTQELRTGRTTVRAGAAEGTLGQIGGPAVVRPLCEALRDRSSRGPGERRECAWGLAEREPPPHPSAKRSPALRRLLAGLRLESEASLASYSAALHYRGPDGLPGSLPVASSAPVPSRRFLPLPADPPPMEQERLPVPHEGASPTLTARWKRRGCRTRAGIFCPGMARLARFWRRWFRSG